MDRNTLRAIHADLVEALAVVAAKHGLQSINVGKMVFGHDYFNVKIEGIEKGGLTAEAGRYAANLHLFPGLPPLGATVAIKGVAYVVVGMNTTGSKVIIEHALTKAKYNAPLSSVINAAKAKAA